MPCNCDHLEPTHAEENSREVAQHIVWLAGKLDFLVADYVKSAAKHIYGNTAKLEEMTVKLCNLCQLPEADEIIYNARDKKARRLADWWEKHQAADKKRVKKELAEAKDEQDRQKALAKLTPHERKLLGFED